MREKIIFDGQLDGSAETVQEVIDLFLLEHFYLPDIDFRVETENHKQIWVIYPTQDNQSDKIINGYFEISVPSITDKKPINFLLVSCRLELDLLFFQLSQRIQAKCIIKDYPPAILATPWKDLIKDGLISPLTSTLTDLLVMRESDPSKDVGKYGTNRNLSVSDVKLLVQKCIEYQARGGTIKAFYMTLLSEATQNSFTLETFKSWVKNKKFRPAEIKIHP